SVAEHDFRLKRQLPEQFSTEFSSRNRFPNDKRSRGTYIHNIKVANSLCEYAGAKPPMSADVDTSEENDENHPCRLRTSARRGVARGAAASSNGWRRGPRPNPQMEL